MESQKAATAIRKRMLLAGPVRELRIQGKGQAIYLECKTGPALRVRIRNFGEDINMKIESPLDAMILHLFYMTGYLAYAISPYAATYWLIFGVVMMPMVFVPFYYYKKKKRVGA